MANSQPNKLFDGQKGFPTPNAPPDELGCRVFSIPADEEYFALIMAAVLALTYPYNWYKNGDLSQEEAAALFADMIEQAYANSLTGQCSDVIPAPYWDTYEDEDDQAPVTDQPWYGELVPTMGLRSFLADDELTWQENAAIWIVAGFGVLAGQIGAAIAFVPFARQFVLKFRGNPIGATAGIFIDGSLIELRDTYSASAKIVETTVIMPDDEDEHTLWVAVNDVSNPLAGDNPTLQVVRKELTTNEIYPPDVIYDPDDDKVKKDWGDGLGFVDYPPGDPRHSTVYLRPPRPDDDKRCASAANMVAWIHNFMDDLITKLDEGGVVFAAINLLSGYLDFLAPEFGVIARLIGEVGSTIFGIGSVALSAAFTTDQYDLLLCIFDCGISVDGGVSPVQLADIQTAVTDQLNTTAALVVNEILTLQGEIGLANAGRIGTETGACDDCGCNWKHCWLGGDGLGDWETPVTLEGHNAGTYNGLLDTIEGTVINIEGVVWANAQLSETLHVHTIRMFYDCDNTDGAGNSADLLIDGVALAGEGIPNGITTDGELGWFVDADVTTVAFVIPAQVSMSVKRIIMDGSGDPPASGVEC